MADPYVRFPGTTDTVTTPDVNLLDADTANMSQSLGEWPGGSAPILNQLNYAGSWSGKAGSQIVTSGEYGNIRTAGNNNIAVLPNTEYTLTFTLDNQGWSDGSGLMRISVRDSGGAETIKVNDTATGYLAGVNTYTHTFSTNADSVALRFQIANQNDTTGGQAWLFDCILAQAASATFQPSMDIVGSLFEEKTPATLPVTYAKGTGLTIPAPQAAVDGTVYTRHDGADATAPIVAQFKASDLDGVVT